MNNEIQFILYQLPDEEGRVQVVMPDKGKVSREEADRKAEEEYRLFNPTQRIDSDFDKEIRGLFDIE